MRWRTGANSFHTNMTEKRFTRTHIVQKAKQPDSDSLHTYSELCKQNNIRPNPTAQKYLARPGPTLDLSKDYLGGKGVAALFESAGSIICRQLRHVNLQTNGITNDQLISILQSMIGSDLEELILDGNCFGRKTASAI